jgi:Xaa-Pro aminopeptidase
MNDVLPNDSAGASRHMFQTFETPADAGSGPARTKLVRAAMQRAKVDAFLVPRADEHQGEYVPPSSDRLRWLTGFSGSAGVAVVAATKALLLVDGRYILQAPQQVPTDIYDIEQAPQAKLVDWLAKSLRTGATIGFDPWLHTVAEVDRLQSQLEEKGLALKAAARNPVDQAWGKERPSPPKGLVRVQPLKLAGTAPEDKIAKIQERLAADGQDAVVLTLPDSICWLFNIRGSDIGHNPVVLAFAIVNARGKPELFIDAGKLDATARTHLAALCKLAPPAKLSDRLDALKQAGKRVRLDPETAAWAIARLLGGRKKIAEGVDPCIAAKAAKTPAEIAGTRAAHVRDGAAMARFLAWLDRESLNGTIDEIGAARQLETLRAQTGDLRDLSFDTISGSGPNGAIVHYRVTTATNRTLKPGELFLVDSGGQYPDGTTDVTRTIAIGKPTAEMRQRYTLVLKGHIALSTARFPKGTRGIDLDPFARRALWDHGLDFDHGTGHGVGSYLSVHEGPQSISKRGMATLEPGMICSNEPGYYKTGAYGIRIENLVIVTAPAAVPGGDRPMMSFETITFVPYDRRLIDAGLLDAAERAWVDSYHAQVRRLISPLLDGADRAWLEAATAAL